MSDHYFKDDLARTIYSLLFLGPERQGEELSISLIHYNDAEVAKTWYLHHLAMLDDATQTFEVVASKRKLREIYDKMIAACQS